MGLYVHIITMAKLSAEAKNIEKLQKKADKAQGKATAAAAAIADASDKVPGVTGSKRGGDGLLSGAHKTPRIAALSGQRTDPFITVPAPIRQPASSTAGTPASSSSTVAAQTSSSSTSTAPASSSSTPRGARAGGPRRAQSR